MRTSQYLITANTCLRLDFAPPSPDNGRVARVVLEHLTKTFRGPVGECIHALKDLSLAVEDRELLVFVGPSGCGKTTTLRLLAGLEKPSAGTITIDGRVVNNVPPKQRDLAMVFQHPALYPHLNAYDNVAFGLKARKYPREEIKSRVTEMLDLLGLSACRQRLPMELSGGERQRLALGRALVRRPGLLLLDEPLSNLDAPMRARMRSELCALHSRLAATFIYVTHDQEEAMSLGQRIAVVDQGALQQVDTPANLYSQPANLFVAGFIGSPGMNLFTGTVRQEGNGWVFLQKTESDPMRLSLNGTPPISSLNNAEVVLGFRPEALKVSTSSESERHFAQFSAHAERVEPRGAELLVHLRRGMNKFTARAPATAPVRPGENLSLNFDTTQAQFFDVATQARVPRNSEK